MEIFAKRLKELRIKKELPLRTVADALDIDHVTLHNYEENKTQPRLELLLKIAEYYDVPVNYLLGIEHVY